MLTHATHGGGDNDQAGDQLDDNGQGDAETQTETGQGGVGYGGFVETVDGQRQPAFKRNLFGSRQQKTEGRAGTDTAQQLGNDIEDAVKRVRFASQHRGNGNGGIELSTGNLAEPRSSRRMPHRSSMR